MRFEQGYEQKEFKLELEKPTGIQKLPRVQVIDSRSLHWASLNSMFMLTQPNTTTLDQAMSSNVYQMIKFSSFGSSDVCSQKFNEWLLNILDYGSSRTLLSIYTCYILLHPSLHSPYESHGITFKSLTKST